MKLNIGDEEICTLYVGGKTISEIAKQCLCSTTTIRKKLNSNNIKLRTHTECQRLRFGIKTIVISPNLIEIIDGLLLGDGYFEIKGNSARLKLAQRSDRIQWLEKIQKLLSDCGVDSKIRIHIKKGEKREESKLLCTSFLPEFLDIAQRWYKGCKKKMYVPEDVWLSPLSIALWYFGDGSASKSGYLAIFSTDCFEQNCVETIALKLNKMYGWTPNISKPPGSRLILTNKKDRLSLVEIVKPFTPPCFEYKLNLKI